MSELPKMFAIITGGSSGLGLHLAKALYTCGGLSIVLGCRNEEKAQKAVAEIQKCKISDVRKNEPREISYLKLDLCDNNSIDSFAKEFSALCGLNKLFLLVNNAGIMNHSYELSKSGFEIHFASNYLGHFRLTNVLLKRMCENGRILNVSSGYYLKVSGIPNDATLKSPTALDNRTPKDYYSISKLANILHVVALDARLHAQSKCIKVVAIQPGFVRGTELGRHTNPVLAFLAKPLIWLISKNLDQGISGMLYCATCEDVSLESGRLYRGAEIVEYNKELVSVEKAQKLWERSQQLCLDYNETSLPCADDQNSTN